MLTEEDIKRFTEEAISDMWDVQFVDNTADEGHTARDQAIAIIQRLADRIEGKRTEWPGLFMGVRE